MIFSVLIQSSNFGDDYFALIGAFYIDIRFFYDNNIPTGLVFS